MLCRQKDPQRGSMRKEFIENLISLANYLDEKSLTKEADALDLIIKEAALPLLGLCIPLVLGLVACGDLPETEGSVSFEFKDPGNLGFATHLSLPSNAWIESDLEASGDMAEYKIAFPCIDEGDPYNILGEAAAKLVLMFRGKKRFIEKRDGAWYLKDNGQQVDVSALIAGQWSGGATGADALESDGYVIEWEENPEPAPRFSHGVSQFGGACVEYDTSTGLPESGVYTR